MHFLLAALLLCLFLVLLLAGLASVLRALLARDSSFVAEPATDSLPPPDEAHRYGMEVAPQPRSLSR